MNQAKNGLDIGEYGIWQWRGGRWEPTLSMNFANQCPPFDPNDPGPIRVIGRYEGQHMIFPLQIILGSNESPFEVEVCYGNGTNVNRTCTCQCQGGIYVPIISNCGNFQCSCQAFVCSQEGHTIMGNCVPPP